MKEMLSKLVKEALGDLDGVDVEGLMEKPPSEELGDYAIPCFAFAKIMRKNPAVIASELKEALLPRADEFGISRIEAKGGYCNLYMDRIRYTAGVLEKMGRDNFGVEKTGQGKTVCMDYSSPNIAKNFHVGHLRTTVIGNSLYKIYERLGFQVVRINYLGDWGTQFGKLIVAYKKWSSRELVEEKGIEELLRIYVKFNAEAEMDAALMEEARAWFVRMERDDEEAIEIWKWFREISMKEFKRVYELLGVSFDVYTGESFYRKKVPALVKELTEKKLLKDSQGAKIIDLEEYQMPPCLITKSDGGSIYHSRDIAAVLDRKEKYHFEKCLYVTGLEQALHFKQIFKAVELMGYDWAKDLIHVPYGLVSLEGAKLSTRNGNIIYAEDILKEAINRAMEAIREKNPDLKEKEKTAGMVGVGAVIFHDLFNQRIKNVDFIWDEVLSFEGNTGPYVQYTYARAKSILRRKGEMQTETSPQAEGQSCIREEQPMAAVEGKAPAALRPFRLAAGYLTDDVTYALVKAVAGYEEAVRAAAERYEPSVIARYLISVAVAFNRFYHECPILRAEEEERNARLLLVDVVCRVLRDACGLLGMECPEEM